MGPVPIPTTVGTDMEDTVEAVEVMADLLMPNPKPKLKPNPKPKLNLKPNPLLLLKLMPKLMPMLTMDTVDTDTAVDTVMVDMADPVTADTDITARDLLNPKLTVTDTAVDTDMADTVTITENDPLTPKLTATMAVDTVMAVTAVVTDTDTAVDTDTTDKLLR